MEMPEFLKDKQYVIVAGAQYGDEGKGEITAELSKYFGITMRVGGGSGTGATATKDKKSNKFRLMPVSVLYNSEEAAIAKDGKRYHLMGPNVLLDLNVILKEYEKYGFTLKENDKIIIDRNASIVNPWDIMLDRARELARESNSGKIGTTGRGMGPAMESKVRRYNLVRLIDLNSYNLEEYLHNASEESLALIKYHLDKKITLEEFIQKIKEDSKGEIDFTNCLNSKNEFDARLLANKYRDAKRKLKDIIGNVQDLILKLTETGDKILIEGTQSAILDVYHGINPYTTSSNTTAIGIAYSAGIPRIDHVVNVVKIVPSKVGSGPFPTKIKEEEKAEELRKLSGEYGTVTGRPRDIGDLDIVQLRYALALNGGNSNSIALTKMDVFKGRKIDITNNYLCNPSAALSREGIEIDDYTHEFVENRVLSHESGRIINKYPRDRRILNVCEGFRHEQFGPLEDLTEAKTIAEIIGENRRIIEYIEGELKVRIKMIGKGPGNIIL